ncbi:patched domain-containing protein 3-like [Diadema antillarum]|uniref:patched domain-containing protein 3-like n=1 Tax=Diadema antillarum TaxID=105358 RepID=UPI003A84ACBC
MGYFDCIDRLLVSFFSRYGKLIGRHPLPFLLGSILVALGLGTGLMFIRLETDVMYLFTPQESQARVESDIIYDIFPVDYEAYLPNRGKGVTDLGSNVIIKPKVGDNVLTEAVIAEILRFDAGVQDVTVQDWNDTECRYDCLCAMWEGSCLVNPVLQAYDFNASRVSSINLTHPFHHLSERSVVFVGASLGEVTMKDGENSTVATAGLLSLSYHLKSTSKFQSLGRTWEKEFLKYADGFQSDHVALSYIVSHTLEREITNLTLTVLPFFAVTCVLLVTFAVASCLVADWVLGKAILGCLGFISALLAIAASSGLLCFLGFHFNIVAASMPFLIIGIGIDDMFIMLAAWRKTNPRSTVEERMGKAYSEAAVSITITSITDALAFGIGAITPLPAVRIFCLFTGVTVVFDYLFQVTFFGACMVYSGRREEAGRHCITMLKVVPRDEAKSKLYKLFCAGGLSKRDQGLDLKQSCETALMTFFKEHYGPALMTTPAKILALFLFCVYIGGAAYGCFFVTEGLEMKSLAGDGSVAHQYFDTLAKDFSQYGPAVSVAILDQLNYSSPKVQEDVERIVQDFESSMYIHSSDCTEFWLRDYLKFLDMANIPEKSRTEYFMTLLVDFFLRMPAFSRYSQDIVFQEGSNQTIIEASRFMLLGDSLITTTQQMDMMADVRKRVKDNEMNMTVFSPMFIIYEQFVIVRPLTLQNLSIALGSMFLVALLLIPHPFCAVMVTACIVSIQVGIFGYMSLWDVPLDGISMINIILCIGFSVDFSAHITYSFLCDHEAQHRDCQRKMTAAEKHSVMALYSLGMPIMQGALSTILAILALYWSPSYIFRAFFKIMFMVMVFGMLHSLVFLPVLLSSLGCCFKMTAPPSSGSPYEMKEDVAQKKNQESGKVELAFMDDGTVLRVYPTFDGRVTVL